MPRAIGGHGNYAGPASASRAAGRHDNYAAPVSSPALPAGHDTYAGPAFAPRAAGGHDIQPRSQPGGRFTPQSKYRSIGGMRCPWATMLVLTALSAVAHAGGGPL